VTEPAPSAHRKYILFTVFTVVSLVIDQWTKVLARHHLQPRGPYHPKVVVDGWFDLRYAENPGVAFLLVLYYLRKTPVDNPRLHVALGLVGGGAIGNLVDRVAYGRVTDFIVWKVTLKDDSLWFHKGVNEWPAFNVADAALCIGVGLMLLDMFLGWRSARKTEARTPPAKA
jgi:signal peptidase II